MRDAWRTPVVHATYPRVPTMYPLAHATYPRVHTTSPPVHAMLAEKPITDPHLPDTSRHVPTAWPPVHVRSGQVSSACQPCEPDDARRAGPSSGACLLRPADRIRDGAAAQDVDVRAGHRARRGVDLAIEGRPVSRR